MKIRKSTLVLWSITIIVLIFTGASLFSKNSSSVTIIRSNIPLKNSDSIESKKDIQKIINSSSFQKKIHAQAEQIYYEQVKKNAETQLINLQDSGFTGKKVSMITNFLKKKNPNLIRDAGAIAKLPRWAEVLAITGAETSFCKSGVGVKLNNCGAIKNREGHFKSYPTKLSSMEDLSNLLKRKTYKNLSISQMNGLYCVDEKTKGKCPNWSTRVYMFIDQIFNT